MPKQPPQPTDAELAILNVLWRLGSSTVRQVQAALENDSGYTTVLKLMQIMAEKGLVVRDVSQQTHVYRAKYSQERTQRQLVNDLLYRAFNGSAQQLVMRALSGTKATAAELAAIRKLLKTMEGE
jgi:predicted transcriptional regulator